MKAKTKGKLSFLIFLIIIINSFSYAFIFSSSKIPHEMEKNNGLTHNSPLPSEIFTPKNSYNEYFQISDVRTQPSRSGEKIYPGVEMYVIWNSLGSMSTFNLYLFRYGSLFCDIIPNIDGIRYWNIPLDVELGAGYQLKVEYAGDPSVFNYSSEFIITDEWGYAGDIYEEQNPAIVEGNCDTQYFVSDTDVNPLDIVFYKRIITTYTDLWIDIKLTNTYSLQSIQKGVIIKIHEDFEIFWANGSIIEEDQIENKIKTYHFSEKNLEPGEQRILRLILSPKDFIGTLMLAFSQKFTAIPTQDSNVLYNDALEEYFVCFKSRNIMLTDSDTEHAVEADSIAYWLKSWCTTSDPSSITVSIINRAAGARNWQVFMDVPTIAPFQIEEDSQEIIDDFTRHKIIDELISYGGQETFVREISYSSANVPEFDFVRYPVKVYRETESYGVENLGETFIDVFYNGFGELGTNLDDFVYESDVYFDESTNKFVVNVKLSQPEQNLWVRTEDSSFSQMIDNGDGSYSFEYEAEDSESLAQHFGVGEIGELTSLTYEIVSIAAPGNKYTFILGIIDKALNFQISNETWDKYPDFVIVGVILIVTVIGIVIVYKISDKLKNKLS